MQVLSESRSRSRFGLTFAALLVWAGLILGLMCVIGYGVWRAL